MYHIGAGKQTLLKLFDWIIDNPAFGVPMLPEPQPSEVEPFTNTIELQTPLY